MMWAPISLTEHVKDSGYYPSFLTDHQYLQVTFLLPSVVSRGPGYWKLNTSVLRDLEYCEFVKSFSSFREAQEVKTDFSSPLEWWDMGKFYLRELSCSFCKAKAMWLPPRPRIALLADLTNYSGKWTQTILPFFRSFVRFKRIYVPTN